MAAVSGAPEPEVAACEEYFLRSGLPHLQQDYDARTDTLTRLLPALLVLFAIGVGVTVRPDWPWWQRALAAIAGLAAVLVLFIVLNLLRGQRPLVRPERVGFAEAGVVVLGPAIVDLVSQDGIGRAGLVAAVWLGVAAVFYFLTSLGVVSMFLHLGRAAIEGGRDTITVAVRAMPPLLAVQLFLFFTTESWQAFGTAEGWRFSGLIITFSVLLAVFLWFTLRGERRDLLTPPVDERLAERARRTPAGPLVARGVGPLTPPLSRMGRINVTVALVFSIGARVVAVGAVTALFFILFGLLAIDVGLTEEWIGEPPNVLLSLGAGGGRLVLTEPLVRVSVLLGAFAALYFAVVALSDRRNREDFLEDEIERVSRVMACWTYYRGALARRAA
jgi:hypothetical protein